MSTFTPNLNLEKPDFNVITWHDQVNGNFDILDDVIGSNLHARYALYASLQPGAGETLVRYIITDDIIFPGSLSGSRGVALIPSVGSAVFSIQRNGVQFGTATFNASTSATFAGAQTTFADGDILSIVAPGSVDATLSGISITLEASRPLT